MSLIGSVFDHSTSHHWSLFTVSHLFLSIIVPSILFYSISKCFMWYFCFAYGISLSSDIGVLWSNFYARVTFGISIVWHPVRSFSRYVMEKFPTILLNPNHHNIF